MNTVDELLEELNKGAHIFAERLSMKKQDKSKELPTITVLLPNGKEYVLPLMKGMDYYSALMSLYGYDKAEG